MTIRVENNQKTDLIHRDKTTRLKAKFLKYIRTKELINYKKVNSGIHISQKELETDFFIYPEFNRKEILKELVENGRLKITKGKYFRYQCLEDGEIDLNLLKPINNYDATNKVLMAMKKHLKNVSAAFYGNSTIYFDTFLEKKQTHLEYFFKVDNFARRVHTPITSLPKFYRDNLLLYEVETCSIDVVQMQPSLLGRLLDDYIGENEFSDIINSGKDIYLMLQEKGNLKSRKDAKKKFFEILFGKPSKELENVFGSSNWIKWINEFKTRKYEKNPRTDHKRHSNLAHLLQDMEVYVMYKIWEKLYERSIPFITIHDEVLIQKYDLKEVEEIFNEVLQAEFKTHKLNVSKIDDIEYSFNMNDLQIQELIQDVINTLCIERGVLISEQGTKLKKDEVENVMTTLRPYLLNEALFKEELKRMYFEKNKSFITDKSLNDCLAFYRENRMLINNKFGKFDFK